jgi:hypothetical protein
MSIQRISTVLLLLTLGCGIAWAGDTPTAATRTVTQPVHGMTMDNVLQVFGPPSKKVAAVGDPPISRWIYPSYVVYFERNIVLHTVSKARPFHDAPPTH